MIRQLKRNDASLYKILRNLSLNSDPLSFLSTSDSESLFSVGFYEAKIENSIKLGVFGFYGFFLDNRLMAYVQLTDGYYPKKRHVGFINEMFVHPDYRRQKIASKLLDFVIKKAKTNPVLEQLHLRVNSRNTSAIKFYEKIGFKRIATFPNSVKEPDGSYQDEYIYCRILKPIK